MTADLPEGLQADEGLATEIRALLAEHAGREGPLLPILHAVQARFGHLPAPALPLIAAALGLSRAEIHGIASFYHDFRELPAGRHVLKLCRAEACQAVGGVALAETMRRTLGIDWGETTPDGRVTLEPVFCLGLCACGPAAMLDGTVIGRATPDRLTEAVA